MKITLFIGSLYGGGAERVICELANYLVYHNHQVEIMIMSETEKSYELNEKIKIHTLLFLQERKNIICDNIIRFIRFCYYLRKNMVDCYVVMLPKTIIMLLMFRWLTQAKVIASERVDPAVYSKVISKLLKKYAIKADGWVFQTEDARNWYEDCIGNSESIIIPNAINSMFIRPKYTGIKRKVIAGAGRLSEQKNFNLLIRAFAKNAEEYPEYNLCIYGEGNKKDELKEMVNRLGLNERVMFPGNIQNIADEMERNTMFVLSSNYEGMPNALMEAMALGLPCISTDCPCGGPRYLIQDGVNGLLVPVEDESKLAEAIKNVLADPEKGKRLGDNANKIIKRFVPDEIYGRWEMFIKNVIELHR